MARDPCLLPEPRPRLGSSVWNPMKTPFPSPPHLLPFCAISPWPSHETFVPFETRQTREARGPRGAVTAQVLGERQQYTRLLVKREAATATAPPPAAGGGQPATSATQAGCHILPTHALWPNCTFLCPDLTLDLTSEMRDLLPQVSLRLASQTAGRPAQDSDVRSAQTDTCERPKRWQRGFNANLWCSE